MKQSITTILFFLTILGFVAVVVSEAHRENPPIAVLQMDGKGWYRVERYQLSQKRDCVGFINGMGEYERFCGAFSVTEEKDFESLPSRP